MITKIQINRRAVVFFIALVVCLYGVPLNLQRAQALSSITTTCAVKWRLPQSMCEGTEYCSILAKVSEDGFLFAYMIYGGSFVVMQPNGELYHVFNGVSAGQSGRILVVDFVPFDQDQVFLSTLEGEIYKYTLSTRTLRNVTPTGAKFRTCISSPWEFYLSLWRIGQGENLLACLDRKVNKPELYGMDLVTFNPTSSTMTTIAQFASIRGATPWSRVLAGRDGFIYITPAPYSLFGNLSGKTNDYMLARYSVETKQWALIKLPTGLTNVYELAFVDKDSNLYVFGSWYDSGTRWYQLSKLNSSGQIVWQLTEHNSDYTPRFIGVSSKGSLYFNRSSQSDPAGYVEECAVTVSQ